MPHTAERLSEFLELARSKSWPELDAAWLETIDDPISDPGFHRDLAQLLVKYHEEARLTEMVQMAAMALNDEGRHAESARLLRPVLRAAPDLSPLHAVLLAALRGAYGDRPTTEGYIRAAGLTTPSDLGASLRAFDQMMWSSEGEVFRHKSWGVGVVVAQDLEGRTVTIDFPNRKNQKFNFAGLREFLEKIPSAHIVSQAALDPEGLRRRAQGDPVAVIKEALEVNGRGMKQADLKALFVPAVFTPAQWTRWWGSAKDKLRLDPHVDVGLGLHGEIRLRDEPKTAAEDVLARLAEATTPHERHQAVREAIRFFKSGALSPSELEPTGETLRKGHVEAEEPADALTWALFAVELAEAAGPDAPIWKPDLGELLAALEDGMETISALPISDHQIRVLEEHRRGDTARFAELCVALIDEVSLSLAKWMMKQLLDDPGLHQAAQDALAQLLHDPRVHPEAYLWAIRQVLGGPWAHLSVANDAPHLLARTLDFLEDLQRRIDREDPDRHALRGLATKIRNALEENHHALIVHTVGELPTDEARSLWRKIHGMTSLSDAYKTAVAASLSRVRDDLEERAAGGEAAPGADFHLVTEAVLKVKRAELQHLRTVEIPQNSRDIQVAREHGDLSENAEYKAAKERQVILHRRAEELDSLLSRARPIDPHAISGDTAVPGTRVAVRDAAGEERSYTLLGIWDSDPDRGVISYLSPLGAQFMRRRAGERFEVTLPTGEKQELEIVSIEKAL
jgi:transcription elongation factor GreA